MKYRYYRFVKMRSKKYAKNQRKQNRFEPGLHSRLGKFMEAEFERIKEQIPDQSKEYFDLIFLHAVEKNLVFDHDIDLYSVISFAVESQYGEYNNQGMCMICGTVYSRKWVWCPNCKEKRTKNSWHYIYREYPQWIRDYYDVEKPEDPAFIQSFMEQCFSEMPKTKFSDRQKMEKLKDGIEKSEESN